MSLCATGGNCSAVESSMEEGAPTRRNNSGCGPTAPVSVGHQLRCVLPLSVCGAQIGLQGQEHAPTECCASVWLGAPWGVIDSPRDSRHRTTCLPPRAKRSKPRLGSGPLLTDPARSRLASGTTVACWGQGSAPIASPSGCHGPPRGGRRARGRACTACQCMSMHPGGSVPSASSSSRQ